MTWGKRIKQAAEEAFVRPEFPVAEVDWKRVVTVDFESFWSAEFTLKKLSTSEYVRDPRFKAQMVGIKIGDKPTKVYTGAAIKRELQKINWTTHSMLAHNCVPGHTEVLTREGWKQIKDVPTTKEIMQWDPQSEALTWCTPLAKIKNRATELYTWDTNFHRGSYTPGHRMYFQTPDTSDRWQVDTAENVAGRSMNNVYVPLSGYYAGSCDDAISIDEARLMEAIRADGSWMITDGLFFGAQFNLRKPRKIERLKELCAPLGVELFGPDEHGRISIRRTQTEVVTKLHALLTDAKIYDLWLLEQPLEVRDALLSELMFWDGHDTGKKGFSWSTASYTTAQTIETVAHLSGWRLSGAWRDNTRGYNAFNPDATLFVATISKTSRAKLVVKPTLEKFTGSVYCFTVPTGAFLIRSGGRICVTGNCAFDGFILSHHYGIVPSKYYDTLSMARGLHSNEIGASLNDVAGHYHKGSKLDGVLETTKGVLTWSKELIAKVTPYCAQDVDLTHEIFKEMHWKMPADEMDLIDLTIRMFCDPVLEVDIPRVQAEYEREIERRKKMFFEAVSPQDYELGGKLYDEKDHKKSLIKGPAERALEGEERQMHIIKRVIGNNVKFSDLLRDEGVAPPMKPSPAYIKLSQAEKAEVEEEDKWVYAFSKDDIKFNAIPNDVESWGAGLRTKELVRRQKRLQTLVDCRLAVKSTTNITRAERFLTAGADGMKLPVGYSYYRAHTGRWGGNNKMNMQNLTRGGELRLSILAPKGHQLCVVDSGQIEARVNGWLWGQKDLMEAFRVADKWDEKKDGVARGNNRDAYCRFADLVYGREITKEDKTERFVGKVCVLGLGYQMGAPKFQLTLAKGALGGPPVDFELDECRDIVQKYRRKNHAIVRGWEKCNEIIKDMAGGRAGQHGPIGWGKGVLYLPNGMTMKYPDLKSAIGETGWEEWSYKSGEGRSKIYGGLLCENIVQALARIIIGWQMLQINKKYRAVMTTHDEVVAMPKTAQAGACYDYMMKVMSTPPAWCSTIPLNCEGGWAANYSK